MDLNQTRYATFDDLRLFCYRVASVVGLMMSYVIGLEHSVDRDSALPRAIELGYAMQLTNILRDVGEDLQRNRVYLPQDEMETFRYSEADLRAHVRNDAFRALMRHQVERAPVVLSPGQRRHSAAERAGTIRRENRIGCLSRDFSASRSLRLRRF